MEEDIKQLKELILDRKSFLTGEKEHDEIYLKDIQAIENVLSRLKQVEEENKTLKKYDYRNIKIDKEHKIKSLSFTKEQLDLMNFGIALYLSFDKLFNDEGGGKNF